MRGTLFNQQHADAGGQAFALQNARMLKATLGADVLARQGSMVAYQGRFDFSFEGGGAKRFLKKAVTGEKLSLMRCRGRGELFLAHNGDEIHLLELDREALMVNADNVLAFSDTVAWDIQRVEGAGVFSGGLFSVKLSGPGMVALSAHGTPVVLRTDMPTYTDTDAVIAWSANLRTRLHRSAKAQGLIGRGSGEALQLAFDGDGFVVVQASEGPVVPEHQHDKR